jgi:adenylate cyclase class 2
MAGADEARRAVSALGAAHRTARHFEDNVLYDDAQRSLLARGCVLRLRRTPHATVLTFKGPREVHEGIRSRAETEVLLDDFGRGEAILAGLGYVGVFRYQKYREAWHWRDAEIVVDETPVGVFLEIEGPAETIHAAAAALGCSRADYVEDSYPALFVASGRTGDMVF